MIRATEIKEGELWGVVVNVKRTDKTYGPELVRLVVAADDLTEAVILANEWIATEKFYLANITGVVPVETGSSEVFITRDTDGPHDSRD